MKIKRFHFWIILKLIIWRCQKQKETKANSPIEAARSTILKGRKDHQEGRQGSLRSHHCMILYADKTNSFRVSKIDLIKCDTAEIHWTNHVETSKDNLMKLYQPLRITSATMQLLMLANKDSNVITTKQFNRKFWKQILLRSRLKRKRNYNPINIK